MRLRACCTARSSKPVKLQVTLAKPPVRGNVTENGMSSRPNASWSARALAAPMHAALPAYEGYGGVVSNGIHVGSGSVAGLRSSAARWMAVTGRHNPYVNLLVNHVMRPSCRAALEERN